MARLRGDLPVPTPFPNRVPAGQDPDLRTEPRIVTLPPERLAARRRVVDDAADVDVRQAGAVAGGAVDSVPGRGRDDSIDEAAVLALARKRFETASNAEAVLRQEMLEDLRFRAGEQWPDQIRADRTIDKRPVITINRLPQFIKQITNPQRQARPSLQINPVGDDADVETAEVLQGLIRHIEQSSHAEVAFDEAYDDAVTIGRGWFRILTEYEDPRESYNQEIVVRRVPNPFSVYVDPASHELDYSDARYMFIVDDIPKDEYRALYGDASMQSLELFQTQGDRTADWFPESKVRIAEYWYVEKTKRTMVLVQDLDGNTLSLPQALVPPELRVLNRREVQDRTVHWIKMNAAQVLEHKVWPGQWIPIVPVLGDEINVNGRKDLVGVVRYARDPQRMYNFWVSAQTEAIALAPRTPFIGAEGQFKGHETEWKQANTRNFAYLEYVPTTIGGDPAPPPQRQVAEPPIGAIINATKQADNDLKSVIGFYDASLGERGPQESGRAILARQKQGETANVNFIDNLGRALWHYGRICLDLIPKIYDAPRTLHILGLDDQRRVVRLNEATVDKGVARLYDMTRGRYNVTLSVGPTYQSKRQEAVASMLQLVASAPNMLPVIGDLLVAEMDWPVARQISERLKKLLPPVLQEPQDEAPIPAQAQAQIQQLQQQLQQQQQALTEAQQTIATKQLDIDSRERVAQIAAQAQMTIAAAKLGGERDLLMLEAEVKAQAQKLDLLHDTILEGMKQQGAGKGGAPPPSKLPELIDKQRQRQAEASEAQRQRQAEAYEAERGRRHEAALEGLKQEHEAALAVTAHRVARDEADRQRAAEQRTAQATRRHDAQQAAQERRHAKALADSKAKLQASRPKETD
jgi:hypothetical protein